MTGPNTRFPESYPAGYDGVPHNANVAPYPSRGWCFTESSWACMVKSGRLVLDLGQLHERDDACTTLEHVIRTCACSTRPFPLTPDAFEQQLSSKRFTNGKDDKPLVATLYRDSFGTAFGAAETLSYVGLRWGDEGARAVAALMRTGVLQKLARLSLNGNDIGDEGAAELASAIASGGVGSLRALDVAGHRMSADGIAALKASCDVAGIRLMLRLF